VYGDVNNPNTGSRMELGATYVSRPPSKGTSDQTYKGAIP